MSEPVPAVLASLSEDEYRRLPGLDEEAIREAMRRGAEDRRRAEEYLRVACAPPAMFFRA